MKLNTKYRVQISRSAGRMHYREDGQEQHPLDYVRISQDGVVIFPLTGPGDRPGVVIHLYGRFDAAWSGKFARMCARTVEFRLDDDSLSLWCFPELGKHTRIPLAIVGSP